MPRRFTTITLAAALAAATLPVAAQAAETYTVDAASADAGCNASKVCKTVTAGVAAAAAGDTVVVKPGTYAETGVITVTPDNVTIRGTVGQTTVTTAAPSEGGAVLVLGRGTVVDGITVTAPAGGGAAVRAAGTGSTMKNGAILRLAASAEDAPAYLVETGVAAGTSVLSAVTIINGPAGSASQSAPAVQGNGTSTLALVDTIVVSGTGNGAAVGLSGSDNSGSEPVPNSFLRSSLIASNPVSDALRVVAGPTSSTRKAVALDTSILLPGSDAAALRAATIPGAFPGLDTPGNIVVDVDHVTAIGGKFPFVVDAAAGGSGPIGDISLTIDRSILRGSQQGTVASFVPTGLPLPLPLPGAAVGEANNATVAISATDTNQSAFQSENGKAKVTVAGTTNTPPEQLFVDVAKRNLHLRATAPVIDKGGPAVSTESPTDIDGQPRQSGAATDLGADEFVNRAPVAKATVAPIRAVPGQVVSYDGATSSDPDTGNASGLRYRWTFGDGATAETTTPTTTHGFASPGLYNGSLTVVDTLGLASAPAAIPPVLVAAAPVVKITAPSSGRAFTVFTTRRTGTRVRKVLSPARVAAVRFAGTATPAASIRTVRLSIRRLAVGRAAIPVSPRDCTYLDGKTTFRVRRCSTPLFFTVAQRSGRFAYRLKRALKPKAGRYQLTVLATDATGVTSKPVTVRFTLR